MIARIPYTLFEQILLEIDRDILKRPTLCGAKKKKKKKKKKQTPCTNILVTRIPYTVIGYSAKT